MTSWVTCWLKILIFSQVQEIFIDLCSFVSSVSRLVAFYARIFSSKRLRTQVKYITFLIIFILICFFSKFQRVYWVCLPCYSPIFFAMLNLLFVRSRAHCDFSTISFLPSSLPNLLSCGYYYLIPILAILVLPSFFSPSLLPSFLLHFSLSQMRFCSYCIWPCLLAFFWE